MATADVPAETRPRPASQLPTLRGPRLPFYQIVEERFGIDRASWKALVEAVFPNATSVESVVLALSYCKARKLDPFKRNVHIVPIWNKDQRCYIDTIWPGIGELRTTAFRTGAYAGRGETVYGPDVTRKVGNVELTFPEWAQVTVSRMVKGVKVDFCGPRVYWIETYAVQSRNDDSPNQMWADRPRGQLEKCAEAAALRAAFPEEVGGDMIPEEVEGRSKVIDSTMTKAKSIDELTANLEGPSPEVKPMAPPDGEEENSPHGEQSEQAEKLEGETPDGELPSPLAGLRDQLDKCTSAAQINAVHNEYSEKNLTEQEEFALDDAVNKAKERVKAAKGK